AAPQRRRGRSGEPGLARDWLEENARCRFRSRRSIKSAGRRHFVRYMLLIYLDEEANAARSEAEIRQGMEAHTPYIAMLRRNRQYAASAALGPAHEARVLRAASGKPVATEGPFAESREQLGGVYANAAEHLDEAIALASECPALRTVATAIEIRPVAADAPADPAPPEFEPFFVAIHRDEEHDEGALDAARLRAQVLAPSGSATC